MLWILHALATLYIALPLFSPIPGTVFTAIFSYIFDVPFSVLTSSSTRFVTCTPLSILVPITINQNLEMLQIYYALPLSIEVFEIVGVLFTASNVPAHAWLLQGCTSTASPVQILPPFSALSMTFRALYWTPPSQDLSHALQLPNSLHLQSTRTYRNACKFNIPLYT